jgi:KUP system potassium uptake protein
MAIPEGDARADALSAHVTPAGHSSESHQNGDHGKQGTLALCIGSIGVVYGDIGTSPLYAFREAATAAGVAHGGAQRADVIGVLSLILWSLMLIVTIKYVFILLRADNNGEGGTLSLVALAHRAVGSSGAAIFFMGAAGAALFYGDAIITPAISVLSAVEGLKLVTPAFDPFILPITVAIIIGLFAVQSYGTEAVARFFGPITLVWFIAMAAAGLNHIMDDPGVFAALSPVPAVTFLLSNGTTGLVALGAVFLAVTGAEALYADLGHFGRKPIQIAWLAVVFPALGLNYLGQGALVLADPKALENPFFLLVPGWALLPMVILATFATIIASQAVITGAYSLTRQAIQLRILPRMSVLHTSSRHAGQIYMPAINWLLLVGVIVLVFAFGTSAKLAAAYGIAVTGTMVITACLAFIVIWKLWKWPLWAACLVMVPFVALDAVFLGANLMKVHEGGYVPLLLAGLIMLLMQTWRRGTQILTEKSKRESVPLADLGAMLGARPPQMVKGTAVFLTADPKVSPPALLHSLKHYKVLHEKNVILTLKTLDVPRVSDEERIDMSDMSDLFMTVTISFGYMESPNVPKALALCRKRGWKFDIMQTSFFLSRRSIKASEHSGMPLWQDNLFIFMADNAADASQYFRIPTGRVVEIGTQMTV